MVVICTGWGLHIMAGMGVQVLSFCWYLHVLLTPPPPVQLSCTPIPAVTAGPHPVHVTTTPPVTCHSPYPFYTTYINTACHFAQLFLDPQILKVKAPSSLKMLRNSLPMAQGHILNLNHHHQGHFVKKEIGVVSLKCVILSHFQSFSVWSIM